MNIKGLDYNTQREKLILPEYGREVQNMVDHAISLPTKEERQRCAETIIRIMERMFPQNRENADYQQKLWDHLAIMSGFQLDIDYPYDVSSAMKIATKPEPLDYPMKRIPVRHYGSLIFETFEKLKSMPPGEERDELARITANQMKRNLMQWSHGANDDEKIADDMARYTDGVIQLDMDTFKFDRVQLRDDLNPRNKRKK
jgi:hypothetical protein